MKRLLMALVIVGLMVGTLLAEGKPEIEYHDNYTIIRHPCGLVEITETMVPPQSSEHGDMRSQRQLQQQSQQSSPSGRTNPVCAVGRAQAEQDIQQELMNRYAPSYSTVEMLFETNMEAFDEICTYPASGTSAQVLQNLKNSYYPHFSTIQMLYQSHMESAGRLGR